MLLSLIIAIPILASILSLLVKKTMRALDAIAFVASSLELLAALLVSLSVMGNGSLSWTSYFTVDKLGMIVLSLVAVVGFAASTYSTAYLSKEVSKEIIGFHRVKQYFVLLHLFMAAMYFAITTANPIMMWIAIEATTLSTAFLISFYGKPAAIEAAWKYLIINSVGLLLAFIGTLLFLSPNMPAGHDLATWQLMLANAANYNPSLIRIAFIFVLIGYGTKVGLAPMHTWLPDAHSKAPVPISSLLSGVLLNVAFLAVLRFKAISDAAIGMAYSQYLLILLGVLSIVVASFIIFVQKNYKRLLAYSSIEHMGIIALGFGFGGIGAFAALLHMIYHSLAKSLLFLSSGNVFLKFSSTKIANVKGMLRVLPVTSVLFFIGFLAITGVPPFGIFMTEFLILTAGIHAHPAVTAIVLAAIALVFVGFLKHITSMMFGENKESVPKGEMGTWTIVPLVFLVTILALLSVVVPSGLKLMINSAVSIYQ